MKYVFNPITGQLDLVNDGGTTNPHIFYDTAGIYRERWRSTPGNVKYDVTMNDSGVLVSTIVAETIPMWFTFYPQ